MQIEIKEVKTKRDLKKFIYLPATIRKDDPYWVPPIYMDEWLYHNPKKNESFSYSDTGRFMAFKEGNPSGRIMTIINRTHNKLKNEKTGRFCWLEAYDDKETVHALLHHAEQWCKERGMEKIIGPFGFSDKDPEGLLQEGRGEYPVIVTNYSPAYLNDHVVAAGYTKETDMVEYKTPIPGNLPEVYQKVINRQRDNGLKLVEFNRRKDIKKYLRPVFHLMNEAYADIYGYMPVDNKEADEFGSRYLPVINPHFAKVILKNNEVVAFVVGMPDISRGLVQAKGRILPFGIIHIFISQKKTDKLVLLLGAVKPKYQGLGLDAWMGVKMMESAKKHGLKVIDSHLILEDNFKMRAEMEKLGGHVYRRYRVYQKDL